MDATFKEFLTKAKRLGLCKEYTEKVDRAGSKKAFIDIALDANGLSWVADCICKGLLSAQYIAREFAPFINGKYVRDADGYTSTLYCGFDGEIRISTTCALIVDCRGVIRVDRPICELYIADSDVEIVGSGQANVYLYGSEADIRDPKKISVIDYISNNTQ